MMTEIYRALKALNLVRLRAMPSSRILDPTCFPTRPPACMSYRRALSPAIWHTCSPTTSPHLLPLLPLPPFRMRGFASVCHRSGKFFRLFAYSVVGRGLKRRSAQQHQQQQQQAQTRPQIAGAPSRRTTARVDN